MIEKAKAGYYDDYLSPLAAPIIQLVIDAEANGLPVIAHNAREGVYDGTKEESEEWIKSKEGKQVLSELTPEQRRALGLLK